MTTWDALWTQPWFWARPWAFALLAVPLLLAALRLWSARSVRAGALAYADAALLPFATLLPSRQRLRRSLALDLLLWALLATAAAGPRQPVSGSAVGGLHRIAVMVLMDAGTAAAVPTTAPISALEQQRLLLAALWPQLRGERLGLIAYGAARLGGPVGAAQLLPPTDDPALFAHATQQARPEVFTGTPASAALPGLLALARQRLQQQAEGERGAVLLLAGAGVPVPADFDASAEGESLHRVRLPLFVLALPGLPAESAALLRNAAQASGGGFSAVTAGQTGAGNWNALYARGIARLSVGAAGRAQPVTAWRELYGLFLLPALALLFWRERPRRVPSAVALLGLALVLGLPLSPPAQAQPPESTVMTREQLRAEHAAWQAWQQGDFARAQALYAALPGYAARMGEGAAAYRLRQYQAAALAFHRALLQADTPQQRFAAFYNLGDASLHLPGRTLEAVQAFDAALRIRPADVNALRNARLAQRQYEIEHPPSYLVGIAKRAPPIHHSRFGQQGSNTPSQLRHKPPKQASAPLQQAAPLAPGGQLATAGAANAATAPWQPPTLDWAGADKRLQLLRDASAELLTQRAAIDTRAAAQERAR